MSEPRYPYLHIAVPSEGDAVELLSSELFELGSLGIEERDASTLLPSPAGAHTTTLVASFADEAAALAVADQLKDRYQVQLEHVVGDAWREAWRAYFKPLRVGSHFVVKPSWEPYEVQPGDLVITLDPGQAFGTGTHESTQLLLAALGEHVQPGMRVLDLGCGSGILAVACALLGASHVLAIDVDPLALSATAENSAANGVSAVVEAGDQPVDQIREAFPLVLANIEARVLVPLAAAVSERVQPNGLLFLSGLLHDHVAGVREAYAGFELVAQPTAGDWAALLLRKGAA
jgi:ribosomal protein L11 methyltransferase